MRVMHAQFNRTGVELTTVAVDRTTSVIKRERLVDCVEGLKILLIGEE
jgi:hypothetical protein